MNGINYYLIKVTLMSPDLFLEGIISIFQKVKNWNAESVSYKCIYSTFLIYRTSQTVLGEAVVHIQDIISLDLETIQDCALM